jgi:four helix bundle protein
VQDFKKLAVWVKSHELTLCVYELTARFPREELYALTSQIKRSASSIPANIAEGCGRDGPAELRRFLQIAVGSASETEYHLLLARDLHFVSVADYERLLDSTLEIKRIRSGLIRRLNAAPRRQNTKNSQLTTED